MTEICVEIQRFSKKMQSKIDKHPERDSLKRGWYDLEYNFLLHRLKDKVTELEDVLNSEKAYEESPEKCADIANFAMMISDKFTTMY